MDSRALHIVLPQQLVREIDSLVGEEGRDSFLAKAADEALHRKRMEESPAADEALRRERLKEFLADPEPAWKDEDHPELVELGTAGWVRSIRQESEERFQRIFNRD